MSTQINITVGSGGLSDKARQLQTAARQVKLEGDRLTKVETTGTARRNQRLAQLGLSPQGVSLYAPDPRLPQIERRPAAYRTGKETLTMSWVVIGSNDWFGRITGDASGTIIRALNPTYSGSNNGRSLCISSTDGTYWHNLINIEELKAPSGFLPGQSTSYGATNETYRLDTGINNYVFDLFPIGNGAFVIAFKFTLAYQKAIWQFTNFDPGPPPLSSYSVILDQASPLTLIYKSFLVSKSSVKELGTPENVKTYLDNKFRPIIATSRTLRDYTIGTAIDKSTNPDPNKTLLAEWGSVQAFDYVQGFVGQGLTNWLNGWWQKAMPLAGDLTGRNAVIHSAPVAYARVADQDSNWQNYFDPVDANGVVTNNSTSYLNWIEATYEQEQTKMKKPIAYYMDLYSNFFAAPMTTSLPVYQALTAKPTGYEWAQGVSPAIPPTDQSYWRLYSTLNFSAEALPMPTVPTVTSNDSGAPGPDKFLCVTTDWGAPSYCRQQALALGFTSADLLP